MNLLPAEPAGELPTGMRALSGAWVVADESGVIRYATDPARRWLNGKLPPAERERVRAFLQQLIQQGDYGLLPLSCATLQGKVAPADWPGYARMVNLQQAEASTLGQECWSSLLGRFAQALRGPASKLHLFAGLLVNGRVDRQAYYQQVLLEETGRLGRLIENLSLLSQLLDGQPAEHGTVSLELLAQAVQDSIWAQPGQDNALYQVSCANPKVQVHVDPRLLGRAVYNLIHFAPRSQPADDRAVIRLTVQGKWVSLAIRSPGFSVPEGEFFDLFEPFARGTVDLELVVVRAILEQHRGHFTAKAEAGELFFTLWLPGGRLEHEEA